MAIWSKGGDNTNQLVHAFTVGDDYVHDRALAPYDILGCIAHTQALGAAKIISEEHQQDLCSCLRDLYASYEQGSWTVEQDDEDVHSKIEALLTDKIGEAGKVLHTGRSRNDQVLTAMRLWLKDQLCDRALQLIEVISACHAQATEHEFHPLPGYTHLQRGMPSSVGMFFAGHAQALLDNLILMQSAFDIADSCPLGSGASYGVGLPLQRELSAELLGFARAGYPAMADANSRGKVECAAVDALGAAMNDLSRFAADMIFFTTSECGFFSIAKGFTTGSSIMPQKKNLDLFELLRGRTSRYLGLRTGLYASTVGLHSGYSRDLQDSKAQCMDALRLATEGLALAAAAIPKLTVNTDAIIAALSPDLYATDEAFRLVMEEKMSFRDAYVKVGNEIDNLDTPDHFATVKNRSHAGSTGNLGLERIATDVKALKATWTERQSALQGTWSNLLAYA
ncbi:MAG: argininosuccinate lyase [Planctomycetes bacterium]|nr:argininosuccinate lyase [Planctomycetota bacterium]